MPRYEVTLVLTLDAESQHDAAVAADEFVEGVEDELIADRLCELPAGDTSLRVKSISWPVED